VSMNFSKTDPLCFADAVRIMLWSAEPLPARRRPSRSPCRQSEPDQVFAERAQAMTAVTAGTR
jgi:hypothetical protein